jgi:xylulokinase
LGGAILAAVACGEYASVEDAARAIVKVKETVKPQSELTEAYQRKYQVFRQLYPAIKGVL